MAVRFHFLLDHIELSSGMQLMTPILSEHLQSTLNSSPFLLGNIGIRVSGFSRYVYTFIFVYGIPMSSSVPFLVLRSFVAKSALHFKVSAINP